MTNVEAVSEEIAPEVEEEAKRTRYTGPVMLEEVGEEEVDTTTSGLGRGRPSIDLSPYEEILKANFKANAKLPAEKKVAKVFKVNTEAVSTVKSRFNTAGANVKVGITWQTVDNADGTTTVKLVAGKRLEGRGRKAGHNDK